jgi:hypothetical protein
MTQKILSKDATIYDAEGFEMARNLTVAIITDSEGDYVVRINDTLHSLCDIMDERGLDDETLADITDETKRLFCCSAGQTITL